MKLIPGHLKPALTLTPFLLLLSYAAMSGEQEPSDEWLPGFERRLEGEIIPYESAQRGVGSALLVRSLEERHSIAWETAPVPVDVAGQWVRFVWLFGIDVNPERREFSLRVDGEEWLRFANPADSEVQEWEVAGREGARLRFRGTFVDRYEDLFGYAFLSLPRSACRPGEPLRIELVGESAGSRVWAMTFQAPVEPSVRLLPRSALVRADGGAVQPLALEVVHLGEPVAARIETSFGPAIDTQLTFGGNSLELSLPEHAEPQEVEVRVQVQGELRHEVEALVPPVRPWTIDLVQHTHTDIGYTRPQSEILPEHLRFIDYALDYCDQTDDFPEDARFRWTCEASWAVREWLAARPREQVERLLQRSAEGRIEITGSFFNMSEVIDEAGYAAFLRPVRTFREAGFEVTTAMQNDINGAAWCLADAFDEIGIRYLTMGQHGHRALKPFDLATSFWWESPAGRRVLAFRADHYNTGNRWGVHTGELATVERGLFDYLEKMQGKGYPFDRVAVQYSGYLTDNSPPSTAASGVIRDWNQKYLWPRLRSSVARDFPRWVEEHHADELPVRRAAWTDWWTDGFGSAARESGAARRAHAEVTAVEGLAALEVALGGAPPDGLLDGVDAVRDGLLFYGEHTFGAAESVTDPLCENSMVQWGQKAAYVWGAVQRAALLREQAIGRLQGLVERSDVPLLVVANTLGHARSGAAEVYVDHQVLPPQKPFRIVDDEGRGVSARRISSRADGSRWALWVEDVPAFGYRTYRIEPVAAALAFEAPAGSVLENEFYRAELDPAAGVLRSLFDKQLGRELVDAGAPWGMGQLILENLGNRHQLEGFRLDDYERQAPTGVELAAPNSGPIWQEVTVHAQLPCSADGVSWQVRLYHREKRVELHYAIDLRRNFEPEGLYVAFPFAMEEGRVVYETLGGIAEVGADILSGAASDWQALQSFAAVRSEAGQVVLTSREAPLVQFGEINLGKFQREARVERPHVYSWVFNNYWTTNFRAAQEGELRWSYGLTSGAEGSNAAASRFGWADRIPLIARVLPAGDRRTPTQGISTLELGVENAILVAARPARDGDGVILHLREVEGRPTRVAIRSARGELALRRVDVLENDLGAIEGELVVEAFETVFLRANW